MPPLGLVHDASGQSANSRSRRHQHRVAFRLIERSQHEDVPIERTAVKQLIEYMLIQMATAEVVVRFQIVQRADHVAWDNGEAGLQAGSAWLRERRRVNRVRIVGIETLNARQIRPIEAEFPIGRIFDDHDAMLAAEAFRKLDDLGPTLFAERQAGRILEVVNGVDHLDAGQLAGLAEFGQDAFEHFNVHAVVIERHANYLDAKRDETTLIDEVRWCLGNDDVARVEQRFADEIKELLRSRRDDNVVHAQGNVHGVHAVAVTATFENLLT